VYRISLLSVALTMQWVPKVPTCPLATGAMFPGPREGASSKASYKTGRSCSSAQGAMQVQSSEDIARRVATYVGSTSIPLPEPAISVGENDDDGGTWPRRVAWADMVSDDDSDALDEGGQVSMVGFGTHGVSSNHSDGVALPGVGSLASGNTGNSGSTCSAKLGVIGNTGDDVYDTVDERDGIADVDRIDGGQMLAAGQSAAETWSAEVSAIANRLQALACSAPSAGIGRCHAAAATDVQNEDIVHAQAVSMRLQVLREEVAAMRAEAEAAEAGAAEAKQRQAEALARVSHAAERAVNSVENVGAQRLGDHTSSQRCMAALVHSAERARSMMIETKVKFQRHGKAQEGTVASLHSSVELQRLVVETAQIAVAQAVTLRGHAAALPDLHQRRSNVEATTTRVGEVCLQMRRDVQNERAKLDAATLSNGTKTEALEARVAHLERECRDLQSNSGSSSLEPGPTEVVPLDLDTYIGKQVLSATPRKARSQLDVEFRTAQESNRQLVADVRRARASRDNCDSELHRVKQSFDATQARCANGATERCALESQLKEMVYRETIARKEVENLREQIGGLERQAHVEEEAAKKARERHIEVDHAKRALVLSRRRAEEVATVLEWRLQKTVAQLDKEKPGAPLVRCLLSSRAAAAPPASTSSCRGGGGGGSGGGGGGSAGDGSRLPLQHQAPRAKSLGGGRAIIAAAHGGSDDADADSTTAGGESMAEGLP